MFAYELGYRRQPVEWFSWDLALFYNVDQKLVNFRPTANPLIFQFFNAGRNHGYGLELAGQVDVTECWKVSGWYSFLRLAGDVAANAAVGAADAEGGNPTHQVFMMSSWDLTEDVEVDLLARYLENAPSVNVSRYISLDARIAWRPKRDMELSIVGQNLLDAHHPEYTSSRFVHEVATEVQRGVYGMVTVEY